MAEAAFLAVAGLALSGCVVGPRYVAPSTPPPAIGPFLSAAPQAASDQPLPAGWWRLYDDALLDQLVQRALVANQDLKVAAANLAYAQGLLEEARAGRYPTTTAVVSPSYGEANPGTAAQSVYAEGFVVAYQVDLFGQIRRAIQAAQANAESVRAAEDATRVTVAAETASAYADICGYGRQIVVGENSVALVQETYDLALAQRNAGAFSDFDVDREGVLLQQAKATLPPLGGQRRVALFTLAALTGATPAELPAEVAKCQTPPTLSQPLPVGDGAALLRRRPDVRQAERALASKTADIGVATAQLYPNVTLSGSIGSVATTVGGIFSPQSVVYGLGSTSSSVPPLISWTFPNVSLARAHIKEARAQASGALATFDSTILTALKETEQALATYATELDHHTALLGAQQQADEALRLARVQLQAGTYSFLDLLQAQATAVAADQAVAQSEQAISDDQVSVFQALGGGWEDAPKVLAPPIAGMTPQIR